MPYFEYLTKKRKDSDELKQLMLATAADLLNHKTNEMKPGMLLGLIQSGKTRAFTGVMAKCFDNGFDIAIIFTKNSIALVTQTINRLKTEFEKPIESNKLFVWDIVKIQDGALTGYILGNKQVIVVKKESNNLDRLHSLFASVPHLAKKQVVIIDDEADQAGVSFVSDKESEDGIDFAKVAKKMSEFRTLLKGNNCFLQVTATPYSLYLQPESSKLNDSEYAPLRPAFTHILKAHPFYIGGEYYFEESMELDSPASYLHVSVDNEELGFINSKPKTIKAYDARVLKNPINSTKVQCFKNAILNFLVGGAIRQKQEETDVEWASLYHCAFVIHTAHDKTIHAMQKNLVESIVEALSEYSLDELKDILKESYHNLSKSVVLSGFSMPDFKTIAEIVFNALMNKFVGIVEVNSDKQIVELLGTNGQLRLDNPFSIFVGGQTLDRGITIDHLIGFFYGRNPYTFQMDTVLQHSRMYGSRSKEDLAVTRFYTSARIYDAMRRMHWFDKDLRDDFIKNGDNAVVRFIAKHGSQIIPAGPNKLKASNLISFRAHSRLLPSGFQTRSQTDIKKKIEAIDKIILKYKTDKEVFDIPIDEVIDIINIIENTFAYEPGFGNEGLNWDTAPFLKALSIACEKNNKNTVAILHRMDREASRMKNEGMTYGDAPDDGNKDRPIAKKHAKYGPVLLLLKQKGKNESGWRNAPFYWPVLVLPTNMPNYVYCEY